MLIRLDLQDSIEWKKWHISIANESIPIRRAYFVNEVHNITLMHIQQDATWNDELVMIEMSLPGFSLKKVVDTALGPDDTHSKLLNVPEAPEGNGHESCKTRLADLISAL